MTDKSKDPNDGAHNKKAEFQQFYDLALLWAQDALKDWAIPCTVPVSYSQDKWVSYISTEVKELYQPIVKAIAKFAAEGLKPLEDDSDPLPDGNLPSHASKLILQLLNSMIIAQMNHTLSSASLSVLHGMDAFIPKRDIVPNVLQSNVIRFAKDISVSQEDLFVYVAVREILLCSLFSRAKWLRVSFLSCFYQFSHGLRYNYRDLAQSIEDAFFDSDIDITPKVSFINMFKSSEIKITHTEEQRESLIRLENLITLIQGWVDVVAESATKKLKSAAAITEMFRRRAITSAPFGLIFNRILAFKMDIKRFGLAREFWTALTKELGPKVRDSLWDNADSFPSAKEVDDYYTFLTNLKNRIKPSNDSTESQFDRELRKLMENPDLFKDDQDDPKNPDDDSTE